MWYPKSINFKKDSKGLSDIQVDLLSYWVLHQALSLFLNDTVYVHISLFLHTGVSGLLVTLKYFLFSIFFFSLYSLNNYLNNLFFLLNLHSYSNASF